MRIAMWSGPRNLSTAMMYAFAARPDCAVVDEPFYAAYLVKTGLDHPMRAEIIAAGESDPDVVIGRCIGSIPEKKAIFYQKHMSHHLIAAVKRDWIKSMANVFLIRHPARVIASYGEKRAKPTLEDIGFQQQAELFDQLNLWGETPVVIDSHDIRDDPEGMLKKLCKAIGLPFMPEMLNWPSGGHRNDGVWAPHWYRAVWNSTGFADAEGALPKVPAHLQDVLQAAWPHYQKMRTAKL